MLQPTNLWEISDFERFCYQKLILNNSFMIGLYLQDHVCTWNGYTFLFTLGLGAQATLVSFFLIK
jgi:hypothetical protein